MVFEEFCQNLTEFLAPHISRFGATCVCLGGNVTKYKDKFLASRLSIPGVDVRQSVLYEDASILGGVAAVSSQSASPNTPFRLTEQALLPIYKPPSPTAAAYDIYPSFYCGENKIYDGYDSLVEHILESKRENVFFDGYVGVKFELLREEIDARLRLIKKNIKVLWREMSSTLKSSNEIDALIEPCGMDNSDPLFGKRCMLELREFFDEEKLSFLSQMNNYDETKTR